MSTRCTITVRDSKGAAEGFSLYRHCDGYPDTPHGVLETIKGALSYAWPLPRFEADDFAASIVAAFKKPGYRHSPDYVVQGGNIYLTSGRDAHCDTEYHYEVYPAGPEVKAKPGQFLVGSASKGIAIQVYVPFYPNGYNGSPTVWKAKGKPRILTRADQPEVPAMVAESV